MNPLPPELMREAVPLGLVFAQERPRRRYHVHNPAPLPKRSYEEMQRRSALKIRLVTEWKGGAA